MTGPELAVIRQKLGDRTQEQTAELLGVSLIGLKRYETDVNEQQNDMACKWIAI